MLNSKGTRELCYIVKIDEIRPIPNYDRVEHARVNGWWVIVVKGQLKVGDLAVYFEIDSKTPEKEPFMFLSKRNFKIKTLKMCKVISQGLLMSFEDFGWPADKHQLGDFVTEELGVTYAEAEDNTRKANSVDKYKKMAQRHGKLFSKQPYRWLMRRDWGKKLLFLFYGRKKDKKTGWPVGLFPGVSKTDQERCENMPWILEDKTPFIVTQKCDGSSGTYILERKSRKKFEFYVCSRNVRMMNDKQECFYGSDNYYWEVANIYNIEDKMKDWLNKHPEATWICWQGEICAPGIQKNPHHLTKTHFYCFHWTDSVNGRRDIRDAKNDWEEYNMEVVPIIDTNYIMPNDFEDFKISADGMYDKVVCEGQENCPREGFVYYKTTDPTFSFKNVSRKYLLK